MTREETKFLSGSVLNVSETSQLYFYQITETFLVAFALNVIIWF